MEMETTQAEEKVETKPVMLLWTSLAAASAAHSVHEGGSRASPILYGLNDKTEETEELLFILPASEFSSKFHL